MVAGKRSLFVDTSGWIEVYGKNSPHHIEARNLLRFAIDHLRPIITTNYVITEFIGRGEKACKLTRQELLMAIEDISHLRGIEIVYVGKENHNIALALLRDRLDKEWSLVDATSFNIMKGI